MGRSTYSTDPEAQAAITESFTEVSSSSPAEEALTTVCHILTNATPRATVTFQQQLKEQLVAEYGAEAARDSLPRQQARKHAVHGNIWPSVSVAVLIVLVLMGSILWTMQPFTVDAQEVFVLAQDTVNNIAESDIQSFMLAETSVTTYTVNTTNATSQIWYREPDQWRIERTARTDPYEGIDSGTRSTVTDGTTVWIYDQHTHHVQIQDTATDQFHLSDHVLFQHDPICYTPTIVGVEQVVQRDTHVIQLGATTCPSNSASIFNGPTTIWVDQETFFVLKMVVWDIAETHPVHTMEVTDIQYNPDLDPSLFTFTPQLESTITDYRHAPASAQPLSPTPTSPVEQPLAATLDIETIRQQVDFQIFLPTHIPPDLQTQTPVVDITNTQGSEVIHVAYTSSDGNIVLKILNGPTGCCLDADPRKANNAVTLADGTPAHFYAVSSAYGGPILWWIQDTTYIALSGPDMAKEDLIAIAETMSPTAELVPSHN